jgi:hypothetical protein
VTGCERQNLAGCWLKSEKLRNLRFTPDNTRVITPRKARVEEILACSIQMFRSENLKAKGFLENTKFGRKIILKSILKK